VRAPGAGRPPAGCESGELAHKAGAGRRPGRGVHAPSRAREAASMASLKAALDGYTLAPAASRHPPRYPRQASRLLNTSMGYCEVVDSASLHPDYKMRSGGIPGQSLERGSQARRGRWAGSHGDAAPFAGGRGDGRRGIAHPKVVCVHPMTLSSSCRARSARPGERRSERTG